MARIYRPRVRRALWNSITEREAYHRSRWRDKWINTTIAFNEEQSDVLRDVTDRERLSVGEVVDLVLRSYLPSHFRREDRPLRWPRADRDKRRWRLHKSKMPSREGTALRSYGILLTPEQRDVLAWVLKSLGVSYSGMSSFMEEAFVAEFPRLFSRQFPRHGHRKHTLSIPRISDE